MQLLVITDAWYAFLLQPWHWAVSGAAIAGILFLMTWLGRSFGVSSTFENLCTIAGAGRRYPLFDKPISDSYWRLVFIAGAVVGGFIASTWLLGAGTAEINPETVAHLEQNFGIAYPQGNGFLPVDLFNPGNAKGILLAVAGGFLVGFGARYGKGCTSGHAITGLSHLQLPSLITVIGFFIGGLIMTWLLMPVIFG